MNPDTLTTEDFDALIWLTERAAVGCLHLGESRWGAQLMDDARRLKETRDRRAEAAVLTIRGRWGRA